jgi:acyl-CoA dehydrogenase
MSDLQDMAASVFADAWDPSAAGFDADLWTTLEETGLARLTLPEDAGGSGASWADAAVVLRAAGQYAARVPLVETDLLAAWLLHAAGLPVPTGPLSAFLAPTLEVDDGRARGTLHRVPWGRSVGGVVALAGERVALLEPGTVTEGANVAEEPRDTVVVDGPVTVGRAPSEVAVEFPLRAALGRSLLIAGAARGALAMAVRYATERVQFGRPIAKLQAIQQTLALAGAEVAAAEAATQAAALEADRQGILAAGLAVAAAKSRAGEAAGEVARIAHQVHGAIGFTREHPLRLCTTRLWAWRDEDGDETVWNDRLGARALEGGAEALWPLLTGTP